MLQTRSHWREAWLDAVAFVVGLAVAWYADWDTTDLVWSLWLSSLVVGYALIVWNVTGTAREFVTNAAADRTPNLGWIKTGGGVAVVIGTLFMLAFFTVHFGGFHFGHSVFLNQFFPIDPEHRARTGMPNLTLYAEVFRRYWYFLPAAFLAERAAFGRTTSLIPDVAVTPEAIAKRKAAGSAMFAPYKNVVRMHLLIFFFAAAHVARIESFIVYAVVYAVYFFPWSLLRRKQKEKAAQQGSRQRQRLRGFE